jgi:2-polyprenyl-3-methyl-5-hydroxy-6-metoxy-1,4-benzoquinol methylase
MDQTLLHVACNLCGALDSSAIIVKGGLEIARCQHCGLVYANPRLTQDQIWKRYGSDYFWDEYMPAHLAADGAYSAEWHRRRNQPLLDLLVPICKPGVLLEVGCAAGFLLKVAEENGWKVKGVEIMHAAVEYACNTLHLDVFEGTLEQARFAGESFDAVLLVETVEHLLDPAKTLGEACRILRVGGVACVTVPNFASLMLPSLGSDWSVLSPAEHLYYFTETTLCRMLQMAGFSKVDFVWQPYGRDVMEVMNPYNTHRPSSFRSRLVKWAVLTLGRFAIPMIVRRKRTDRLIAIATR